jgi:hypothetical protein
MVQDKRNGLGLWVPPAKERKIVIYTGFEGMELFKSVLKDLYSPQRIKNKHTVKRLHKTNNKNGNRTVYRTRGDEGRLWVS